MFITVKLKTNLISKILNIFLQCYIFSQKLVTVTENIQASTMENIYAIQVQKTLIQVLLLNQG